MIPILALILVAALGVSQMDKSAEQNATQLRRELRLERERERREHYHHPYYSTTGSSNEEILVPAPRTDLIKIEKQTQYKRVQ